jgi:hypothetical protein
MLRSGTGVGISDGAVGSSAPPPPPPPSLALPTALGTGAYGDAIGVPDPLLLGPFTLAAGETILLWTCMQSVSSDMIAGDIIFNGNNLTRISGYGSVGTIFMSLWYYTSVLGETGTLLIDVLTHAGSPSLEYLVSKAPGISSPPEDLILTKAASTSTAPTIGPTGTAALANELVCVLFETAGNKTDTAGAWGNSLTGGQRDGTTAGDGTPATIHEAYRIDAVTTGKTASKTGQTSRAYKANIITLKGY